mgnify:CR=1 FL=1
MGRTFTPTRRAKATTNREAPVSFTLWDYHVPEFVETDDDGNEVVIKGYDVEVIIERYVKTKTVKGTKVPDGHGYALKVMGWPTDSWRGHNAAAVMKFLCGDGIELSDWLHDMAVVIDGLLTEQDADGNPVAAEFCDVWKRAYAASKREALKEDKPAFRRRRPKKAGDSAKSA